MLQTEMREHIAGIYVETSHSAYRDVLPTSAAETIYDAAKELPELLPLLDKLLLNWRAAAYLATMPSCFVTTSDQTPKLGMIRSDSHVLSVTELLLTKLEQKVTELSIDPSLRRKLRLACLETIGEYRNAIEHITESGLENEHWETMLKQPPFVMYIWYSQRACYMFTQAAFEHFLVGLVQIKFPSVNVRVTDRDFSTKLKSVVGESAERKCWSGNDATIRKEVRHSLAHKSGHSTDTLAKQNHGFIVTDGLLQIGISNNKTLFKNLAENVILVCCELKKAN